MDGSIFDLWRPHKLSFFVHVTSFVSNSDIWRDFPRFVIPIFSLVYLDVRQGSQTSVAGAVCDFEHLQVESNSTVAYLQPYHQYMSSSLKTPIFPDT
eukprot:scaffold5383_cov222-Amphora_coffeaeformis.AAC.8